MAALAPSLQQARRLVVKIGSALLVGPEGLRGDWLRGLCDEVTRKINELDLDRNEHTLVLEALAPLDPGRKCYRLVNNVVVERTVAEVMPAVKTNRDQIVTMMNGLGTQLEAKQKEADEISSKYRISSTPAPAQQPKGGQAAEPAEQQGVLI